MRQIWVVDDDRSIRWVLEKALTRAQMPFRLFESAADVVKAFEHDTPSVLLSDIRMHDMSGLDLLAFVKNKYPGLPVIIMTAFSDLDSAVSAFQGARTSIWPNLSISTVPLICCAARVRKVQWPKVRTQATWMTKEQSVEPKSSDSRVPCRKCFERSAVCRIVTSRCF